MTRKRMSENNTQRQSAVNLNTILLFVLLGVFGWLCHTAFVTSNSVIRLETTIQNFPSRMEVDTRMHELNAALLTVRARIAEVETQLIQLRRERPSTTTPPRTIK